MWKRRGQEKLRELAVDGGEVEEMGGGFNQVLCRMAGGLRLWVVESAVVMVLW